MADKDWSQSPVVVLPYRYRASAMTFLRDWNNGAILKDSRLLPKRKEELNELMSLFKEYGGTYQQACIYYESMISSKRPLSVPRLTFLDQAVERTFAERHVARDVIVDVARPPPKQMVVKFPAAARRRWDAPDID